MINFIIKLLRSKFLIIKKKCIAILIKVNKFTKYFYIILFIEKYTIEKLETVILDRPIQYYKIIIKITNNSDKLFTFNYQKILILLLKIK